MGKAQRQKRQRRVVEGDTARRPLPQQPRATMRETAAIALIAVLLAASTLAVYLQAVGFGLVKTDDQMYVTDNTPVRMGLTRESVRWAFNIGYAGNWHPLTWLSHMLDCQIYGVDPNKGLGPGGYHLTNILLHIASTLMLFGFLVRATGHIWRSGFVAGLFALHPLHVESVAWVAERKDVLSTFFLMLTMLAYLHYSARPSVGRYLLVAATFALGLMAKPMLVTLPVMLLILDYWPLGRFSAAAGRKTCIWKLVWEKTPLLTLSVASSVLTVMAQGRAGAVGPLGLFPLAMRVKNATMSYAIYLWKTFWPTRLAAFYPLPADGWPIWQVIISAAALAAITVLAIRMLRSRPYFAAGWFWYVLTLVPVVGLIQVGSQARADRYTYIPLIGIFIIVAYGVPELIRGVLKTDKAQRRGILAAGAVGVTALAVSAAAAHRQVGYWRDSTTMFQRAIDVVKDNWFAEQGIAGVLQDEAERLSGIGERDKAIEKSREAIAHLRRSLAVCPDYADAHNDLARALALTGDLDQAIAEYRRVLELNPNHTKAHNNLANAYLGQGRIDEALAEYQKALRLEPGFITARYNMAIAYQTRGDVDQAIDQYLEIIRLNPNDYFAYFARFNAAVFLMQKNRRSEAIALLNEAVKINSAARVDPRDLARGALAAFAKKAGP